jgi:hypothetical protein
MSLPPASRLSNSRTQRHAPGNAPAWRRDDSDEDFEDGFDGVEERLFKPRAKPKKL